MDLKNGIVGRIEVTARLKAMPMLGRHAPVIISLWLITELPMTRLAPNMLRSAEQVFVKLRLCSKPEQAGEADKIVAGDGIVILEVILKSPCILKSTQTEVAGDVVSCRVVDVILQAIAVDKHALAEVAVIFVPLRCLLDVREEGVLV